MKSHYQVLGISIVASSDEITDAYRLLMRKYHPDINPNGGEMATEITLAYATLSNGHKRSEYDRTIGATITQVRPESVILVSEPMEFAQNRSNKASPNNARFSFIKKARSSVGGNILLSIASLGTITWIASLVIGFTTINGVALGLSSLAIFLLASTLLIFIINPIRHPSIAIALLILVFALPLDYLNQDNLLPNLLTGLSTTTALAIATAYGAAVVTKIFWVRVRRLV